MSYHSNPYILKSYREVNCCITCKHCLTHDYDELIEKFIYPTFFCSYKLKEIPADLNDLPEDREVFCNGICDHWELK